MTNDTSRRILHLIRSNIAKGGKIVDYIFSAGGSDGTGKIVPVKRLREVEIVIGQKNQASVTDPVVVAKVIASLLNHNNRLLLPDAVEPSNILPWLPKNEKLQIELILPCLTDPQTPMVHIVDMRIGSPVYTIKKI